MIYQLLFLTFATLAATCRSTGAQRVAFLAVLLPLVVFVGTREWTGCDFAGYLRRFSLYQLQFAQVTPLDVLQGPEALFGLINYAVVRLELGYMWVNVACAVLFFACLAAFALRREAPMTLLALSFPILIVQLAMSGIRQASATAILLLAWNAFSDGRRLRMLLFVALAGGFHQSALMFAPLAFAAGREVKLGRLVLGMAVMTPVAILFSSDRLDVYQDRYGAGEVESAGAALRVALIATTALLFELNRGEFRRLYPGDYALMRIFSLCGLALVAIAAASTIAAHRIGYYVMPVSVLTLARLPRAMLRGRREVMLELAPLAAYGLYVTVWFGISKHARLCYIPYDSFLF